MASGKTSISLTTKSASVPVVDTHKSTCDRAGEDEILRQYLGLIAEHIGTASRETLVVDHVLDVHCGVMVFRERDRLAGIADVLVEAVAGGSFRRRVERQLASLPQVELPRLRFRAARCRTSARRWSRFQKRSPRRPAGKSLSFKYRSKNGNSISAR